MLDYLGRYTHCVALSNNRILAVSNGQVSFQWKDYRSRNKHKSRLMTISADEFIRFLLHTLPPGFQRIRYFGWLANRFRQEKLPPSPPASNAAPRFLLSRSPPCPRCSAGVLIRIALLPAYRWPQLPPDSS